jgi:CRP-like cAMP-binding protein
MSIEDDILLLDRVPTIHLLGNAAIRVLAIGAEQQAFARGAVLFRAGDAADCGYVVQRGAFRISFDGERHDIIAGPGTLIGELAMIAPLTRPATAEALEESSVIRINRSLFQRVLESDPEGALRLRNELAARTGQATSDIVLVGARLAT